ncbi:MAG: hypothetical protein ABW148_18680 [Sedimenticola sp.]
MSIEEREDSEQGQLGELPESLRIERQENAGYTKEGTRYDGFANSLFDNRDLGPPPDIALESAIRNRPGEMGSIPRRFDVTSTFDVRPVNGRDFLETFYVTFLVDGDAGISDTETVLFNVPDGYIGIIRGFRYYLSRYLNIEGRSMTVSVIADSVILNNYDNMLLEQIVNDFIPVYGISTGLKDIGLKITHPEPMEILNDEFVECRIELYGNLLLSRGIPSQYEPTNSV